VPPLSVDTEAIFRWCNSNAISTAQIGGTTVTAKRQNGGTPPNQLPVGRDPAIIIGREPSLLLSDNQIEAALTTVPYGMESGW